MAASRRAGNARGAGPASAIDNGHPRNIYGCPS